MSIEWIRALGGGILIGVSVSLMLFWNGRVTGISSIFYGVLSPIKGDWIWRICFLAGLVIGGLAMNLVSPDVFQGTLLTTDSAVIVAGLLVGFGTALGSGCTSGHGVCGISRLSIRSIVATGLFIFAGMLSVIVFRGLGVFL